MAVVKIGKVVMRSLFKKPATKMYPVIPNDFTEITRGHVSIIKEDCILCGICSKKCPTNAITVDKQNGTWSIARMQCIQCQCCAWNCPKSCLEMGKEYTAPSTEKVVDTFEIPKKEKKAAGGAAAPSGNGLQCKLEDCIYCGLCAKNCPCDALTVDRKADPKVWAVDKDACSECGACVDKCPKKCLTL